MSTKANCNSWTAADLLKDSCIRMETKNQTVEREDWGYRVYDQQDDVETHVYFLGVFKNK